MRIHHVVPHFHPDLGGTEAQVLRLGRYLADRGHEVVVHTSLLRPSGERLPPADEVAGIRVRRYRPSVRLGYYMTLFRPRIEAADVVHLHGYGFVTNDRVERREGGRVPIVYSLHHGVAQPAPTPVARFQRAVYDRLVGAGTLRRVLAIVAASDADRRWLEHRNLGRGRVHVLPTGLEEEAFRPGDAGRARERLRIRRYVLFLGRLHREKNADHLLRAVASLARPDVSVVLIGPDEGARAPWESLASRLGLAARVRFAGPVDDATKRDLLAGCECLVLPSLYEAQGIAILEAWAQGRPVVASRVGGVPDVVEDGRDGLLYPWGDVAGLADHLGRILDDPASAAHMGQAGLAKARERFSWDRIAPRFEALYAAVDRR